MKQLKIMVEDWKKVLLKIKPLLKFIKNFISRWFYMFEDMILVEGENKSLLEIKSILNGGSNE